MQFLRIQIKKKTYTASRILNTHSKKPNVCSLVLSRSNNHKLQTRANPLLKRTTTKQYVIENISNRFSKENELTCHHLRPVALPNQSLVDQSAALNRSRAFPNGLESSWTSCSTQSVRNRLQPSS